MMTEPVKRYPLTYEQESVWLDEQLRGGVSPYLESCVHRLSGPLDPGALEWALARMAERHESLRSTFGIHDGQLVQMVSPAQDLRLLIQPACTGTLDDQLHAVVSQPLDLECAPLRWSLLRLSPDDFVLAAQFHHIVVDDHALAVFARELGEYYRSCVLGRPPELDLMPYQLGDYAAVQRSTAVAPSVLAYWQGRLRGLPRMRTLPHHRPRPARPSRRGGVIRFPLDAKTVRGISAMGRALHATRFTIIAAALIALLHRYSGNRDIVVGTPVSRRGTSEADSLIGCLTDLMPLRQALDLDWAFPDLVLSVRTGVREMLAHRDIPYAALARKAVSRAELGGHPLCQVALVVDDTRATALSFPGVTDERLYPHPGTSKFDLCLTLVPSAGNEYMGFLEYSADIFDRQAAEGVAADFRGLLAMAVSPVPVPLRALPAVTA